MAITVHDTESFGWAASINDVIGLGAFSSSSGTQSIITTNPRWGDGQGYLSINNTFGDSWLVSKFYDSVASSRALCHVSWFLPGLFSGSVQHDLQIFSTLGLECIVRYDVGTKQFHLYRNAVLLATSTKQYSQDGWRSVQVNVHLDNTSGRLTLWVDEEKQIDYTGDVCHTGGTIFKYWRFLRYNQGGPVFAIADWKTGTPTLPTEKFDGDVRLRIKRPTGAGSSTQFAVVGAASNWQAVDDPQNDGDVTYVHSANIGDQDLYATTPASITGTVNAVVRKTIARKDGVGLTELAQLTKSGATVHTGASFALGSTFGGLAERLATDPDTGAAWTISAAESIEIGQEVITA